MNMNKTCPCCSGKQYHCCCQPLLSGKAIAATPEQLMRSRYSAYTQANIPYLFKTMSADLRKGASRQKKQQWAKQVEWLKLEALDAPPVDSHTIEGEVEFKAYFKEQGQVHVMHERSKFLKEKGRWLYVGTTCHQE